MSLGKRIKSIREDRNIPATTLANSVGITKQVLWQIENEYIKNPNIEVLKKIATETNVTFDYIMQEHILPKGVIFDALAVEYQYLPAETKDLASKVFLKILKRPKPQAIKILTTINDMLDGFFPSKTEENHHIREHIIFHPKPRKKG